MIVVAVPPYIGRGTRRVEDERLVAGAGRYAGDIKLEDLLRLSFCRSTLPHARIRAIDRSAAQTMPGVIAVWTADELPEVVTGLGESSPVGVEHRGRPILNRDEVNYIGEAYGMVVAETSSQAHDAGEQVSPELEPLPGVGNVLTASAAGAPTVHADMKSNIALAATIAFGDIKAAFASDSVTAKIRLTTARVAGAAMELRSVTATPDSDTGGVKVWTPRPNIFLGQQAVAPTPRSTQAKGPL